MIFFSCHAVWHYGLASKSIMDITYDKPTMSILIYEPTYEPPRSTPSSVLVFDIPTYEQGCEKPKKKFFKVFGRSVFGVFARFLLVFAGFCRLLTAFCIKSNNS